jgi:hypothetical protein
MKELNISYKQKSGASVTASYGIIIEYFYEGEYPLDVFFENYRNYFHLDMPPGKNQEEIITKHFQESCYQNEKRKLEFIQELHHENIFNTRTYCGIAQTGADAFPLPTEDLMRLRDKLRDGGLAMVLYDATRTLVHSIVLGYDTHRQQFFKRDPSKQRSSSKIFF